MDLTKACFESQQKLRRVSPNETNNTKRHEIKSIRDVKNPVKKHSGSFDLQDSLEQHDVQDAAHQDIILLVLYKPECLIVILLWALWSIKVVLFTFQYNYW